MKTPRYCENPCNRNTNYYCKCGHCYTLYGINKRKMNFCYNCGRPINTKKTDELRHEMLKLRAEIKYNVRLEETKGI